MMTDDENYTVDEVAVKFNVTPQSVRNWIKEGKLSKRASLPGTKKILIPKKEVDEYLKVQKEE